MFSAAFLISFLLTQEIASLLSIPRLNCFEFAVTSLIWTQHTHRLLSSTSLLCISLPFSQPFFALPPPSLGKRVEVIGPAYTHRKRKAKTHAHLRCGLHCVSRPNARVTQRLRITPLKIISAQGMNSFFFSSNGNNVFNLDQPVRSASRITASRATGV